MIWSGQKLPIRPIILALVLTLLISTGALAAPLDAKGGVEKVDVILVAANVQEAKGLAQRAGGEVTHELGIINGVAVSLPQKAVDALSKNPNIRIYPNSILEISSGAGPILRDEFSSTSYAGSNGNTTWANIGLN